MKQVNVANQSELNAAIKAGDIPLITSNQSFTLSGEITVRVSDSSQPRVVCYDSSQPRVECSDSSQPRVECYGSSQPRVVCYGSSQPRVECYGSSQPRVVCSDSSQPRVVCSDSSQPRVVCYGSSQPRVECANSSQPRVECYGYAQLSTQGAVRVKARSTNQITVDGPAKVVGGKVIRIKRPRTAAEWCAFHGVQVKNGVAILFKGLNQDYLARNNFAYTPGTKPVAPDWDGGEKECGGGLHFSPRPTATHRFTANPKHYVACPVRLKDMRKPTPGDEYPDKIKAKGCCAPVWECDICGEKI